MEPAMPVSVTRTEVPRVSSIGMEVERGGGVGFGLGFGEVGSFVVFGLAGVFGFGAALGLGLVTGFFGATTLVGALIAWGVCFGADLVGATAFGVALAGLVRGFVVGRAPATGVLDGETGGGGSAATSVVMEMTAESGWGLGASGVAVIWLVQGPVRSGVRVQTWSLVVFG